jgi:LacI family transcriptional regulator
VADAAGRRVTLKDIAEKTGYTMNTVSHALRNRDDIAPATRELIKAVASDMGYIGNAVARAMRSGRTFTVAVILGDISNPLFAIRVRELEAELRNHSYDTLVINTEEDCHLEARAVRTALARSVDGVIICPTQCGAEPLELLRTSGVPYVLMGRRFPDSADDYVVWDDREGARLATSHLLEIGRRRIIHLSGPTYISSGRERVQGYHDALDEAGVARDPALVMEVGLTTGSCKTAVDALLARPPEFDAIFAFSDLLAWEAAVSLEEAGLRVPTDIALVGYDDIQSGLFAPFPLSTISASKHDEARLVVTTLLERMGAGPVAAPRQVVITPTLVRRRSS